MVKDYLLSKIPNFYQKKALSHEASLLEVSKRIFIFPSPTPLNIPKKIFDKIYKCFTKIKNNKTSVFMGDWAIFIPLKPHKKRPGIVVIPGLNWADFGKSCKIWLFFNN